MSFSKIAIVFLSFKDFSETDRIAVFFSISAHRADVLLLILSLYILFSESVKNLKVDSL